MLDRSSPWDAAADASNISTRALSQASCKVCNVHADKIGWLCHLHGVMRGVGKTKSTASLGWRVAEAGCPTLVGRHSTNQVRCVAVKLENGIAASMFTQQTAAAELPAVTCG